MLLLLLIALDAMNASTLKIGPPTIGTELDLGTLKRKLPRSIDTRR